MRFDAAAGEQDAAPGLYALCRSPPIGSAGGARRMISSLLRPPDRPRLTVHEARFPLERAFTIARGSKTAAHVVSVEILDGTRRGRGESVPYARYGETVESVIETIEQLAPAIETGMVNRRNLERELPPGAARNAIDLALWDFDAKRGESSVWQIAALDEPHR